MEGESGRQRRAGNRQSRLSPFPKRIHSREVAVRVTFHSPRPGRFGGSSARAMARSRTSAIKVGEPFTIAGQPLSDELVAKGAL
jgi:hypothetical protein